MSYTRLFYVLKKAIYYLFVWWIFSFYNFQLFSQPSLNKNEFPLPGTQYIRWSGWGINLTPGASGANQFYDFSGATVSNSDTINYLPAASTSFAANHPGASVAVLQPAGDINILWYYSSDTIAFWTSGATLIGSFGTIHANHPAPYTDTLLSNEYTYGHSETEVAAISFPTGGNNFYQIIWYKLINADGYGTLKTPMSTFNNVLRVRYVEYQFDTAFQNGIPTDTKLRVSYYYRYFAKGFRHPAAIAYTDSTGMDVQYLEMLHIPPVLAGCTDTAAANFNPIATQSDSNCIYCNSLSYSITSDTSICKGDSVIIAASGATKYLWSTGDSIATIKVAPSSSQTYNVYMSSQQYCWKSASVNVNASDTVQAGFWVNAGVLSSSDSIQFVNTSSGATNYLWLFDDSVNNTSALKNPRHKYSTPGDKNVVLIAYNLCDTDTFMAIIAIVGTEEFQVSGIKFQVYPNPSEGKFSVVPAFEGITLSDSRLVITNLLGEIVYTYNGLAEKNTVDISAQPAGVYIVSVYSNHYQSQKLIVKH